MKTCNQCKEDKEDSQFHKRGSNLQPICKVCRGELDKLRRKDPLNVKRQMDLSKIRRIEVKTKIHEYLSNHPCVKCGENGVPCLQFHHLDPSKKSFNVADCKDRSWRLVQLEIAKCEVLCANCHAKETALSNNWYSFIKR